MRYSLREFLVIAGVASLAMPALMYATALSSGVVAILMAVLFTGFAIKALVLSGSRQCFAIGFVCACLIYVAMLLTGNRTSQPNNLFRHWNIELDPYSANLLTTQVFRGPFEFISGRRSYYVNMSTGKKSKANALAAIRSGGGGGIASTFHETPQRTNFFLTLHCLWTLLFGYLGGKYAVWVYERQSKQPDVPTAQI